MLEEIMLYCRNFFYKTKEHGNFIISNNQIKMQGRYIKGQYIRIIGSMLNDGVYMIEESIDNIITVTGLNNEIFEGYIMGLAVPKNFLSLASKIEEYKINNKNTDIVSESLGNYSYSKATINGKVVTWENVFFDSLKPYRKLTDGFRYVASIESITGVPDYILDDNGNYIAWNEV